MCGTYRDAGYVSCKDAQRKFDRESFALCCSCFFPIFVYLYPAVQTGLICSLVTCSTIAAFGLFFGGLLGASLFCSIFAISSYYFSICIAYTIRNTPYAINRCSLSLHNSVNRGINSLTRYIGNTVSNCCSRLARLVGFSSRNEQETDVESSSAEELSEITTMSSSYELAFSEEQGQPQLPRRLSFASRAPFLSFYPPERTVSEAMPQRRRPSFASWTPFSFFRTSSEEADLENGNTASVESKTDMSEDTSLPLTT